MIDISPEIRGRTVSNLLTGKRNKHDQASVCFLNYSLEYLRLLPFKHLRKHYQISHRVYNKNIITQCWLMTQKIAIAMGKF